MAVKHTKVATVADDGTSEVGTNEWNDDHTIDNNTITDDMVDSHTTTKITVPTTKLSGTVTNTQLAGSIANTKLATDPLARANHTGSQAQSTVTSLTSDLALKSPLASPTFTGTVAIPNYADVESTLDGIALKSPLASPTFTGTVTTAAVDVAGNNIDNVQNLIHDISGGALAIDFSADQLQTLTITNNSTFTTSNRATGKSKTYKLYNSSGSSTYTFTFPAWKFVGAEPADIAPTKIAILTLTCFGTADTDIVAAYAVEE